MINYDEWAEELQKNKMDLIELLQAHTELVEKVDQLKERLVKAEDTITEYENDTDKCTRCGITILHR